MKMRIAPSSFHYMLQALLLVRLQHALICEFQPIWNIWALATPYFSYYDLGIQSLVKCRIMASDTVVVDTTRRG